MGGLRSARRKLKQDRVWKAEETQHQRIKILQTVVAERAAKDAEFANDLIKAVGENLPPAIRKTAEETIARELQKQDDKVSAEAYTTTETIGNPLKDIKFPSVKATEKSENWSGLPEDSLLIMNAPPSDYPENQGMTAYKEKWNEAMEERKVTDKPIVIDKLKFTSGPVDFEIDPSLQEYDGEKIMVKELETGELEISE